jgi:serine/threonine-protein kinase
MPFTCIHCRSEIDPKYKACPFCGEPITDFLRRHLEHPIDGKYQILSRLGVGGMGEVYKALHIHLNAIRVIKMMRAKTAEDPAGHDRFLREARLATKIHHPNVAALYDFSTLDDGSFYMVWEYIEGINLHEMLVSRGPLSPQYAGRIAIQALQGLDAIHRAGIVHRDVSPENLMIARDAEGEEHVKIIDLGIAKGDDGSDMKTKTGMFVGKWKYCSPEHLGMLPDNERIDGRADIYSFGIVLYEMLTGVPPFQSDTPHGYLMQHASERPRPLREVNTSTTVSPILEALIFRALEKDRTKRFASARDFARAIEEILPTLTDSAGEPPPLPITSEVTADPTVNARATTLRDPVETVGEKPLVLVPPPEETAPSGKGWIAVAAVALLIVVGAIYMWMRPHPVVPVPTPKPAPPPAVITARIAVNAWPWGQITSIRNVKDGKNVDLKSPLVTPAPIDLAPGRYEITFSNPAFQTPITKTVDVAAGDQQIVTAQFADPLKAPLPVFVQGTR